MNAGFYGLLDFTGLPVGVPADFVPVGRSKVVAGRRFLAAAAAWHLQREEDSRRKTLARRIAEKNDLGEKIEAERRQTVWDVTAILLEV